MRAAPRIDAKNERPSSDQTLNLSVATTSIIAAELDPVKEVTVVGSVLSFPRTCGQFSVRQRHGIPTSQPSAISRPRKGMETSSDTD